MDVLTLSFFLAIIPISFEVYRLWKSWKEHKGASKNLSITIEGNWYSAELDLKQGQKENAILEIEIKRKKIGNQIEMVTRQQLNTLKNKTAWTAKGKIVTINTLILDWKGKIDNSMRFGSCFMQFIENGRGIGYWIGYASNKALLPAYGYWILSKDKEDLNELAELALKKFDFVDVKDLVENKEKYRKRMKL